MKVEEQILTLVAHGDLTPKEALELLTPTQALELMLNNKTPEPTLEADAPKQRD